MVNKKVVGLFLVCSLTFSLLAGCGKAKGEQDGAEASSVQDSVVNEDVQEDTYADEESQEVSGVEDTDSVDSNEVSGGESVLEPGTIIQSLQEEEVFKKRTAMELHDRREKDGDDFIFYCNISIDTDDYYLTYNKDQGIDENLEAPFYPEHDVARTASIYNTEDKYLGFISLTMLDEDIIVRDYSEAGVNLDLKTYQDSRGIWFVKVADVEHTNNYHVYLKLQSDNYDSNELTELVKHLSIESYEETTL